MMAVLNDNRAIRFVAQDFNNCYLKIKRTIEEQTWINGFCGDAVAIMMADIDSPQDLITY